MNAVSRSFALKSRRVVIDGDIIPATIVIADGKISEILRMGVNPEQGIPIEDVGDKVILPGLVDTHVHINEPGRTEWEGFTTATQAAAAGGVTTLVDMPLNCSPVTISKNALLQKIAALQGKLWVDCGFWGGVVPHNLDDLDELIQAGVLGVKSFTIDSGIDDFPPVDKIHLRQAMKILAKYGVPYLIHAELEPENNITPDIGNHYSSFLKSRPKSWENQAVAMMVELLKESRAEGIEGRVHIVHLSSAEAIPAITNAKALGLKLSAETCPHYLTLYSEEIPDGKTLFKCCPPIREDQNRQELWQALEDGIIEFVVSDHSPCTPHLKHIGSGDLERAWGGISSLQFGLSLIWTEAKKRGIGLNQLVEWMAVRPAKFAGLAGKKGVIAAGYDADLIIFDDDKKYRISKDLIKCRHKITPYEGQYVSGLVEKTYLRGVLVYSHGESINGPLGETILRRKYN